LGLAIGVLDNKIYSIMLVVTLVTLFSAAPLIEWAFPPQYRIEIGRKVHDKDPGTHMSKVEALSQGDLKKSLSHVQTVVPQGEIPRVNLSGLKIMAIFQNLSETPALGSALCWLDGPGALMNVVHVMEQGDSYHIQTRIEQQHMIPEEVDPLLKMTSLFRRFFKSHMSFNLRFSPSEQMAHEVQCLSEENQPSLTVIPVLRAEGEPHLADMYMEADFCSYLCGVSTAQPTLIVYVDGISSNPDPIKTRVAFLVKTGSGSISEEILGHARLMLARPNVSVVIVTYGPKESGAPTFEDVHKLNDSFVESSSELKFADQKEDDPEFVARVVETGYDLIVFSAPDRGDVLQLSTNLFLGPLGRSLVHFGVTTPFLIFQESRKSVTINGQETAPTNLRGSTANLQMMLEQHGVATSSGNGVTAVPVMGDAMSALRRSAQQITGMFKDEQAPVILQDHKNE